MKEYLKTLMGEKYIIPLLLIAIIVGTVGVYNLGWKIDYRDHPLVFVIFGWIISVSPTPLLLLRSYLIHKRVKPKK